MFIKKTAVLVMIMMLTMGGVASAKELKPKTNVPIDKMFEIEMSGNVKENTVEGNIIVTTEGKKQVEVTTSVFGKYIFVQPLGKYRPGTTYHLTVKDKIRDTKNRKFKEYNSFKFTTAGTFVKEEDIVKKPIGLPVGATLTKKEKYHTYYAYKKEFQDGGKLTEVVYTRADNSYSITIKYKNDKVALAIYYADRDRVGFNMATVLPVSKEALEEIFELGREFASYRTPYE